MFSYSLDKHEEIWCRFYFPKHLVSLASFSSIISINLTHVCRYIDGKVTLQQKYDLYFLRYLSERKKHKSFLLLECTLLQVLLEVSLNIHRVNHRISSCLLNTCFLFDRRFKFQVIDVSGVRTNSVRISAVVRSGDAHIHLVSSFQYWRTLYLIFVPIGNRHDKLVVRELSLSKLGST